MQAPKKFNIVAVAIILAAGVGAFIYLSRAQTNQPPPNNVYKDENLKFQISYPHGWVAEKNPDGVAILSLAPEGSSEGAGIKLYVNRLELDSTSIDALKNSLDNLNKNSHYWNPDIYKSVITPIGGFNTVLVNELTGYADPGYSMYVLLDDKNILEFSGDISNRDIFLTLKRI